MLQNTRQVVAIDPGREKCGLAVVDQHLNVRSRAIVPRSEIVALALLSLDGSGAELIALGHSTQSNEVRAELEAARPGVQIEIIDERNSTLEARDWYWRSNPPRGWRRFLPLSLQTPPEPLDDWAAVVLAQRYFAK
ncbi:MAG TPA: hypothetical protein VF681_13440 [Abditibacteriaceae bacterium]|jgi:RNase H-fold protein (predicted Holliday junction resolvase)